MTALPMKHPGELTLRRFLAEELLDAATTAHLEQCADCTARLQAFEQERREFKEQQPFERFASGVERAARTEQQRRDSEASRRRGGLKALFGLAACLVAIFAGRLLLEDTLGNNRLKGIGAVDFVVASASGQQRAAAEREQLAPGERVRIGVSGHRHVLVMSIDDAGVVSTLYEQTLPKVSHLWLPDSLEFTGRGRERLMVLLSDVPVGAEVATALLREQYQLAGGDLSKLKTLGIPGVQVHRIFLKP